jgi:hypothetical protein
MTGHAYLAIQEQYLNAEESALFYDERTPQHVKVELTLRAKLRRAAFNRVFQGV